MPDGERKSRELICSFYNFFIFAIRVILSVFFFILTESSSNEEEQSELYFVRDFHCSDYFGPPQTNWQPMPHGLIISYCRVFDHITAQTLRIVVNPKTNRNIFNEMYGFISIIQKNFSSMEWQ